MAFYGIDLGTTLSSVAYSHRGVVTRVPLEAGGFTLASTVLLDATDPTAPTVTVGRPAVTRYRSRCASASDAPPGLTLVRGSKHHLAVTDSADGPPWYVGSHSLYATDVGALLLRALAGCIARDPSLPPVDAVVVTHPQRLRNRERRAVAQSAHMAGLRSVSLLPEPDAAAWAYGLGRRFARDTTFLVFDFGGGTLDVTVMRRSDVGNVPRLDAVASYGVSIGGMGIDEIVRAQLFARYLASIDRESLTLDALSEASRESLLATAEGVKIQLNQHATGDFNPLARTVSRTFALETSDGEPLRTATVKLTLGELSDCITDVTERSADCADEALSRAGIPWSKLDEVFLVGGSSWLHPVQERLRQRLGDPSRVRLFDDADDPLNPATAVSAGAARYCENLALEGHGSVSAEYHGVIPDAFGVRAREPDPERPGERRETLAVLVPARTKVPFEGRRTFRKRGGAKVLPIEVLEGSSLAEATPLGCFVLGLDGSLPDGAPVEVSLKIARDGVLSLALRDPATDHSREVELTDAEGLYADDELDQRRHWVATVSLKIPP